MQAGPRPYPSPGNSEIFGWGLLLCGEEKEITFPLSEGEEACGM